MRNDTSNTNASPSRARHRRWVPPAVVAFTLAWAVLAVAVNRALPNREPVPPGDAVEVGGAVVTDLEGWTLDTAASDLAQQIVLDKGDQVLLISYHGFGREASGDDAWQGFEHLLSASTAREGGIALGDREPLQVEGATQGEWSGLHVADRAGAAFVVTADDGLEAVEGTVLGPLQSSNTDIDAALAVVQSVEFLSNMEAS